MRIRAVSTVSALLATSALVAVAGPAEASSNTFQFSVGGSQHMSLAANGTIMIDGSLAFDNECRDAKGVAKGIRDFVYPASDVYIVNAGATLGDELTDVG